MKKTAKKKRKPATIKRAELSTIKMVAGGEKKHPVVILGGDVRRWVGFGWVNEGKADAEDRKNIQLQCDSDHTSGSTVHPGYHRTTIHNLK